MTIDPFNLRIKFDQYRFCYIFNRTIDFKQIFLVAISHETFIVKNDIDKALRYILNKKLSHQQYV